MLSALKHHRRRQKGQALVETVIVLATVPVMLVMFNAMFYFSEGISNQIRLSNFARYAAIKQARNEVVNTQGVMSISGGEVPAYSLNFDNYGFLWGAIGNGVAFLLNPVFAGQLPHIGPYGMILTLANGNPSVTANATFTVPPSPGLSFSSPIGLQTSVSIDARTWTSGDGLRSAGWGGNNFLWRFRFLGYWLLQDLIFNRLILNGTLAPMDFGTISSATGTIDASDLLASILAFNVSGFLNFFEFIIP